MNFSPILIVPGEKKSIFFEIFFKSLKSKSISSPLILICDKKNLKKEIKQYKYRYEIEQIELEKIGAKKFHKNKIYLIHVCFDISFQAKF